MGEGEDESDVEGVSGLCGGRGVGVMGRRGGKSDLKI